jgi:hypothetical protein
METRNEEKKKTKPSWKWTTIGLITGLLLGATIDNFGPAGMGIGMLGGLVTGVIIDSVLNKKNE